MPQSQDCSPPSAYIEPPSPCIQESLPPALRSRNTSSNVATTSPSVLNAEELARTKFRRPAAPLASQLLEDNTGTMPTMSTSVTRIRIESDACEAPFAPQMPATVITRIPVPMSHDFRRRALWLKARAQDAGNRNRRTRTRSEFERGPTVTSIEPGMKIRPRHKLPGFIKEEEMALLLQDRANTPHPSELSPEDYVCAPLQVNQLALGSAPKTMKEAFVKERIG